MAKSLRKVVPPTPLTPSIFPALQVLIVGQTYNWIDRIQTQIYPAIGRQGFRVAIIAATSIEGAKNQLDTSAGSKIRIVICKEKVNNRDGLLLADHLRAKRRDKYVPFILVRTLDRYQQPSHTPGYDLYQETEERADLLDHAMSVAIRKLPKNP